MRRLVTMAAAAWLVALAGVSGEQAEAGAQPPAQGQATDQSDQPLLACCSKRFALSAEEIARHQRDAYAGFATPALLLFRYHWFAMHDAAQARHWLMIGAENGSAQVMVELASFLSIMNNENDKLRARFWLEKAKASGEVPWSDKAAEKLSRY